MPAFCGLPPAWAVVRRTRRFRPQGLEAFLVVPVGAFVDPGFPTPGVSIYEARKHAWVVPPPEAVHIP
jgi:hypothetical protein